METEVKLPKMGESVMEATITKWLKAEGEMVEQDESLLEVATDKVDSERPSPASGILLKRMYPEGAVVQIGKVIAIISTDNGQLAMDNGNPQTNPQTLNPEPQTSNQPQTPNPKPQTLNHPQSSTRFYSPLVKNIASTEGVSTEELEAIAGTGMEGRLTKDDLIKYIKGRGAKQESAPVASIPQAARAFIAPPVAPSLSGDDEIIEMDRMRKMISDHMTMSKRVSAHVTSFVEADVTNLVLWREKVKGGFEKRENEKLTFTPIFIEAVAKAIREMPMINVSVDGTKIILRKNINIGMATALPSGNLIVPVIKNADRMNLVGLTKAVNDLANRARTNKLKPDEIQGGTFTITNVGTFGNVMGTPIINQPQVAILATGAIKKKPAVIETPQGDTIGIRHFMFLSLSYDHRVVDGALGGRFVRKVADFLEQFNSERKV